MIYYRHSLFFVAYVLLKNVAGEGSSPGVVLRSKYIEGRSCD